MAERTVSFPTGSLGLTLKGRQLYSTLYEEITQILKEEDIEGVQIYPASWPRKVLITVKEKDLKERLLIEGMSIFGSHVELRDENSTVVRVTVQDAPIEWEDSVIVGTLAEYGTVVRVEKEHIYHENRRTSWTTGTRYVYFSPLMKHIPQTVSIEYCGQKVSVGVWYRERVSPNVHCGKCGSGEHNTQRCPKEKKVCYRCGESDHLQSACPQNDGTKRSDKVVVFMSEKSVFSNFNIDCPVEIDGYDYVCNEQFIQAQKAVLCGDDVTAHAIMKMTDPREMKRAGNRVRNYDDAKWKECCDELVMRCVREKFRSHEKAAAALRETGDRLIGEATTSPKWGIGLHIRERAVLNPDEWSGKNTMGEMLMKIRAELSNGEEQQPMVSADGGSATREEQGDTAGALSPGTVSKQIDNLLKERGENGDGSSEQTVEYGVLIGDSNVRDLQFPPGLPVKMISACTGGTTVQEIEERVKEVQVRADDVKVVAVHVGSCNWSGGEETPTKAKDIYIDYVEALNAVSTKYRHADLLISGTILRNSENPRNSNINKEIENFNNMLRDMCKKEANIMYVGHDNLTKTEYYRSSDFSGVHLNSEGKHILASNLAKGIKEAHYQNILKDEWYVYNTDGNG